VEYYVRDVTSFVIADFCSSFEARRYAVAVRVSSIVEDVLLLNESPPAQKVTLSERVRSTRGIGVSFGGVAVKVYLSAETLRFLA
jgi:hypothetical protein